MAKINPSEFSWSAPTENVDGSPIADDLSYTLMLDGVDFLSFPGSLNADGKFFETTENMNLPLGLSIVTLKAFYINAPTLISDPSNGIDILVGVGQPNPPLALDAV